MANMGRVLAGLATFIGALGLIWQSQSALSESVALFWCFAACMQLGALGLWQSKFAAPAWGVLALACALHAAALFGRPMFEDDYYRYLWDGYQTAIGNPYTFAPEVFFTDTDVPQAMRAALDGINNPEIPTIYGPLAQRIFALGYTIAPGNERALRAVLAMLHLGLIGILLFFARSLAVEQARATRRLLVLYLTSPLVFKEVALTGHFDFLVPMGLIAAWLCLQPLRGGASKTGQYSAGALIGLAFASKVVALLALPLFVWRGGWRAMFGFALAVAVLYWPFLQGGVSELAGLGAFADAWRFNSGVFALLEHFGGAGFAKAVAAVLVVGLTAACSMRAKNAFSELPALCVAMFAALILLGPVINPWYWLWLAPLLPLCLGNPRLGFAASGIGMLLLLSYGHGLYFSNNTYAPYALPAALQWFEHLAIALLVLGCFWPRVDVEIS